MSRHRYMLVAALAAGWFVGLPARGGDNPREDAILRQTVAGRTLLEGNKFKALRLAETAIKKTPRDWREHYALGAARSSIQQYALAREAYAKAAELEPGQGLPAVRGAETFTAEAMRKLARLTSGLVRPDAMDFQDVITELREGQLILDRAQPVGATDKLDVQEARGIVLEQIATTYLLMARYSDAMAKAQGDRLGGALREKHEEQATKARAEAVAPRVQASRLLKAVLEKDPSRTRTASILYTIALQTKDEALGRQIEKIILAMPNPPAGARLKILLSQMGRLSQSPSSPAWRKWVAENTPVLDDMLRKDPNNVVARNLRASLALATKDFATARRLAQAMLDRDPNDRYARLILAKVKLASGDTAEAERDLVRLKALYSDWAAAHLAHARAASKLDQKDAAIKSVNRALELEPDNARAKALLAELKGEKPKPVDLSAKLAETVEKQPEALIAFARWAKDNGKRDKGLEVLGTFQGKYAGNPDVLQAVAAAYSVLGEMDRARQIMKSLADMKPTTSRGRVAVAAALLSEKRQAEAQTLLEAELRSNPKNHQALFLLGGIQYRANRRAEALASFQKAVELDGTKAPYRLALAQMLVASGRLDEAEDALAGVDQADPKAAMLRTQIATAKGQTPDAKELMKAAAAGGQAALLSAVTSLRSGQLDQAIRICQDELSKPGVTRPENYHTVLAQAYQLQGKTDLAKDELRKVIRANPTQPMGYRLLARLLGHEDGWAGLREKLTKVPGADATQAELAAAELMIREKRPELATAVLEPITVGSVGSVDQKCGARLLLAQSMAMDNRLDAALGQLRELQGVKGWTAKALEASAALQIQAKRLLGAEDTIKQLAAHALAEKDAAAGQRAARMLLGIDKPAAALDVAEQLRSYAPEDAASHVTVADALRALNRGSEAEAAMATGVAKAKAGEIVEVRMRQAELLAGLGQRTKALDALESLAALGEKQKAVALVTRGKLLASWGLYAPASKVFQEMARTEMGKKPEARLQLGRALAMLGDKARARESLLQVPAISPLYVTARLMLADLADSPDESLRILDDLARSRPGEDAVAGRRMAALLRAKRPAEAAKVIRGLVEAKAKISPQTISLGLRAMLLSNDRMGAAGLCSALATQTGKPQWRHITVALVADSDPKKAAGMLPPTDQADPYDAALGLSLAVESGDSQRAGAWLGRLKQIQKILSAQQPRQGLSAGLLLLATVAGQAGSDARQIAEVVPDQGLGQKVAARELVSRTSTSPAAAAKEAALLLKAQVAIEHRLGDLGRDWAMAALKARPTCQWAAVLVAGSGAEADDLKGALVLLAPDNTPTAQALRAQWLMADNQWPQALEQLDKLARLLPSDRAVRMRHAMAAERAGKQAEALTLYKEILDSTPAGAPLNPAAANNAAYLVSQLVPNDRAQLAQAEQWASKALKVSPKMSALQDTLGWLMYLQQRGPQEILPHLRQAVSASPTSVENQYHLGVVEAKAGYRKLARWHLEAAVQAYSKALAGGEMIPESTKTSADKAREELAKLP